MLTAIRASWTLFLGLALVMLGNGLQVTLLGVRATYEGFPTTVTGVVMTGYYAGFLIGSVTVPRLVANVGHVRVFAALASLASVSVLVHAAVIEPVTWAAMRLVTGFSYAGLYIVIESWLNTYATNDTRGQLLSIYMVVSLGCMTLGQLLLNLSSPEGYPLFILTSVLVSLALVPISLTVVAAPPLDRIERIGPRRLYRSSPLAVVAALGTGVANGALFSMGAVYAAAQEFTVGQISYFMFAAVAGGLLLQWPIGRLSDRFDRRRIMTLVTLAAAAAALAVMPFAASPGIPLFLAIALFGGLTLPMYSLCIAHANDHLQPGQMIAASGTMILIYGIGSIFGPVSAAQAMETLGPNGLFLLLAAAHAAIGVFALYRMTRRAATPLAEQGPFVPVAPRAVSPVAAAIAAEEAAGRTETRN